MTISIHTRALLTALGLGVIVLAGLLAEHASAAKPTVIELTQTGCQFIESENGVDQGFVSTMKSDCEAINARTGATRLAEAKVLTLKPGTYIFRVTNKNVPYQLGFWLRGSGIVGRVALPSVSGGGLNPGATKDYTVTLKPGEYLYSCPLNPTPDYKLVVEG
jgi:hypothetical protein